MCSQPPKKGVDDYLLTRAFELINLLPQNTTEFTLTGGEPTLYGDRLLQLLALCRERLPNTHVQLLSNGRKFADQSFALDYASVTSDKTIVAIPLYAAEEQRHDYIVQSDGAFDETVRGILNLARLEQRVEIRVVLHNQTILVLGEIADFIARNLPFVERVALMGLEITGLTRANLDELWVDPFDYREALADAVSILDNADVPTMIYNHQLCLLEPGVRSFAVKSISDWKNEYEPACDECSVRDLCGGFFYSARYRKSEHIMAIHG
jgi:His-Xaa-Ser system radical SAM maturase HxsC